jgi:mono/diheme cytochrome c family protein
MQICKHLRQLIVLLSAVYLSVPASAADSPSFSRDIQTLLAKHCVVCHGPNKAESGLRLDMADQARSPLDSGATAIVPGKPDASELLARVTSTDEATRMPPEGDPLSATEVAFLRQWIQEGAAFEQHWAYQPVEALTPPEVQQQEWIRNPIDQFVLTQLEAHSIAPSPEADPAILIKRLHYDLVGLPPTPAEVDAFVADTSPNAWESLVDRLLDSEHFGERWGRHWLDKARYADSDGYEKDRPRPNAWRYRDWVIDAINRDVPFDQFTIEQLAGDLLPNATPMQKLATAFHRQTLTNTEGGTDQEQFRVEATFDRTETTSAVWMALTMTCARCHTHKYDQITHEEYYQLFAFFNNANEAETDVARSESEMAQYHRDKAAHDSKVVAAQQQYDDAKSALAPQVNAWTQELRALTANKISTPAEYHNLKLVDATADSKATLTEQKDGSLLVSGTEAATEKYTTIFELPEQPLAGIRIETLAHDSLPSKGPGRAGNGNFVLNTLQAYISEDKELKNKTQLQFGTAQADFSQNDYPAENALSTVEKSGWAIAPKAGVDHQIVAYTRQPVPKSNPKYLQIVMDQQYGGQHVIGCFRVSAVSGFDPIRSLPSAVATGINTEASDRTDKQRDLIAEYVASITPETATFAAALAELKSSAPKAPLMPVRVIVPAERTTNRLHRGDFLQPADEVASDTLSAINRSHPLTSRETDKPADRLDLARWLVDPAHPLTSRVTVNQVWAHLFGRGIVATQNDFGVRGEQPTHPQLLDWLAWQFPRDMKWSRKTLIKTIVMSSTWRQSSNHRPELQETDPTNLLLARQNRVRAEAEVIRDLHLAASGLLSNKVGGPSVFPPLPPGVAELSYANNFKWNTSKDDDAYRRGMYTFFKRTSPHPTLVSFDCPDSNTTRLQRETSNTPIQALVTLNNEVYTEAAQALVRRAMEEGGDSDQTRLTYALRLCIARTPSDSEVERFEMLLSAAREYYQSHSDDAKPLIQQHPAESLAAEDNAAWVATVRMIMNLDEFIVRD